jgi:hypothetical protein
MARGQETTQGPMQPDVSYTHIHVNATCLKNVAKYTANFSMEVTTGCVTLNDPEMSLMPNT